MLKFYIAKRAEREFDGYKGTMEFENHHELEDYLRYNRASSPKCAHSPRTGSYSHES